MTETANEPTISLEDIQAAIQIIDLACETGALRGWETFGKVLAVRQRFSNFYNHTLEQHKTALAEAKNKAASDAASMINP